MPMSASSLWQKFFRSFGDILASLGLNELKLLHCRGPGFNRTAIETLKKLILSINYNKVSGYMRWDFLVFSVHMVCRFHGCFETFTYFGHFCYTRLRIFSINFSISLFMACFWLLMFQNPILTSFQDSTKILQQ